MTAPEDTVTETGAVMDPSCSVQFIQASGWRIGHPRERSTNMAAPELKMEAVAPNKSRGRPLHWSGASGSTQNFHHIGKRHGASGSEDRDQYREYDGHSTEAQAYPKRARIPGRLFFVNWKCPMHAALPLRYERAMRDRR